MKDSFFLCAGNWWRMDKVEKVCFLLLLFGCKINCLPAPKKAQKKNKNQFINTKDNRWKIKAKDSNGFHRSCSDMKSTWICRSLSLMMIRFYHVFNNIYIGTDSLRWRKKIWKNRKHVCFCMNYVLKWYFLVLLMLVHSK